MREELEREKKKSEIERKKSVWGKILESGEKKKSKSCFGAPIVRIISSGMISCHAPSGLVFPPLLEEIWQI